MPDLQDIQWSTPWESTQASDQYVEQLRREMPKGHALEGLELTSVARRTDCDDVLFQTSDAEYPFVVVHLPWSTSQQADKDYPSTVRFSSFQEWAEECMKADHAEFMSE